MVKPDTTLAVHSVGLRVGAGGLLTVHAVCMIYSRVWPDVAVSARLCPGNRVSGLLVARFAMVPDGTSQSTAPERTAPEQGSIGSAGSWLTTGLASTFPQPCSFPTVIRKDIDAGSMHPEGISIYQTR